MTSGFFLLPVVVFLAVPGEDPRPFPIATVHFEQNATDGDVEVVFRVKAGDAGLSTLKVIGPDGRTVIDFDAPDSTTLGIRQFHFESPEPPDIVRLKFAYPEGVYRFTGTTTTGIRFMSEDELNHVLPGTAAFVSPAPHGDAVAGHGVRIRWRLPEGLAACIVEVEQDSLEVNLTTRLPGNASMFELPSGFLLHGLEYQLSIGTVSANGNQSFVQTTFRTAGSQ